jgi:hypothetical protein
MGAVAVLLIAGSLMLGWLKSSPVTVQNRPVLAKPGDRTFLEFGLRR